METTIKHLEIIQAIIARISTNSFILKGWTITICAGLVAISATLTNQLSLTALFLLLIFWWLDGHFRSLEKKYRALYNDVRVLTHSDFNLDISSYRGWNYNIARCMISKSLLVFHGSLILILLFYIVSKNINNHVC